MINPIPISTVLIGIHGLIAFGLTYLVVMERTSTKVWHGESRTDIASQPDYLKNPNKWAALVDQISQKTVVTKAIEDGVLQRTVRAHANFTEHVPLALLFIIALELAPSPDGLVWLLGGMLAIARIFHAWGLIQTYGPSPARAIGFFGTWFVYIVGSLACLYYGITGLA
ncbi:MAG: MAPEG family protein [Myxacorys chilensis ATA2-1-KO14]|jgi:hypothetical protein|nr:MAPEG family protein [Myxacorys chilensis ATA2-1-KO14]